MIRIIKRGTPPEPLLYDATCTHCGTEYEFTRDEAVLVWGGWDQRENNHLRTSCPVCKRDVFSAFLLTRVDPIPAESPDTPLGRTMTW